MSSTAPPDQHRERLPRIASATAVLVLALVAAVAVVWMATSSDGSVRDPAALPNPTAAPPGSDETVPNLGARPTRSGSANVAEPAPSQVDAERPRLLRLPSGTTMPVDTAATGAGGELVIPADINRAGWWDGSSRLGDPYGSVVLAAHIDSFTQGLGRFAELLDVQAGDVVVVSSGSLTQEFRVVSAALVSKSALSATSAIYAPTGASRLVLITCGGAYDVNRGGYQDNMIVEAVPVSAIQQR